MSASLFSLSRSYYVGRNLKFSLFLWLTHQRLRLKRHFVRLFRIRLTREKALGLRVNFFGYKVFTSLFRQMFLTREYYFQASSATPFIIDCGSNIGMSVLYFKWLYPESVVLAFEPDRPTFGLLERNIRENGLQKVELHNKALSDRHETVTFYSKCDTPGSLLMSTIDRKWQDARTDTVDAVPLSPYIDRPVDFLKMDIEGAEGAVIAELARGDRMKFIKEMVIEYHHHIDPEKDHLSRILSILEINGFGYLLRSCERVPFRRNNFQDILIYAYHKS